MNSSHALSHSRDRRVHPYWRILVAQPGLSGTGCGDRLEVVTLILSQYLRRHTGKCCGSDG